ncbi:MAG TPA: hypothetical protein VG015_09375 [Candidatus Dormibacteraeota bacterium]|jgi:hypothetical protein|nr:hypothetical protein [Candidatus Dormibacteraeota bacterium]
MILFSVEPRRVRAAEELFQFLKVPAQPYKSGRPYHSIVSDGTNEEIWRLPGVIIFGVRKRPMDEAMGFRVVENQSSNIKIPDSADWIPARCGVSSVGGGEVVLEGLSGPTGVTRDGIQRFGFDLFGELERMLGAGQSEGDSHTPTLTHLVGILRDALVRNGPVLEVLPNPLELPFVLTLSHDIDQMSLAEHGFGERWLSFIWQSMIWPLQAWLDGRMPTPRALKACLLAIKSPLIRLGLFADPWKRIEAYLDLEDKFRTASTYFFIPFRGRPGFDLRQQTNHRRRAAAYDLSKHSADVSDLMERGAEIGLHGIDSWHSVAAGVEERNQVAAVSGRDPVGVRMHFLYLDMGSFAKLEQAGFDYDSSFAHPRMVGFRSGTMQPFQPLDCDHLLEFPVNIEDGCLFSPSAMSLSEAKADQIIDTYLDAAEHLGGCLNASWHDHSLGPPRFWGPSYSRMLQKASEKGAWLARLDDACRWYRRRRDVKFEVTGEPGHWAVDVMMSRWPDDLPRPGIRIHQSGEAAMDLPLTNGRIHLPVAHGLARTAVVGP